MQNRSSRFPDVEVDADVATKTVPECLRPQEPLPDISDADRTRVSAVCPLIELILKDRRRLDAILRTSDRKVELATRLLTISVTSFVFYAAAISLVFHAANLWPAAGSIVGWLNGAETSVIRFVPSAKSSLPAVWQGGQSLRVIFAYSFGLIAASGICLPSLYFYGLLSGLRMTMADVALHSLKGTAVSAVALIGILPVYAAVALGALVLPSSPEFVEKTLTLGLLLPFIGGLWGTHSLFVSFMGVCHTMPESFQAARDCFIRRLVLSWCVCYTAVAPVMIVTVWRQLGN